MTKETNEEVLLEEKENKICVALDLGNKSTKLETIKKLEIDY